MNIESGINMIIILMSFFLGIIFGYSFHDQVGDKLKIKNQTNQDLLVRAITFVFTIAVLVDIASTGYDVPFPLYTIMGGIVGYYVHAEQRSKDKD